MPDAVEYIDGSLVQHGSFNNRIYLMHLNTADIEGLIATLENLAHQNGYGKIFAKVPARAWPVFKSSEYLKEAVVPGFFNGRTHGFFIAKYFSVSRQNDPLTEKRLGVLVAGGKRPTDRKGRSRRNDNAVAACRASDAVEMSSLYREVFPSYPFPIHQPAYLKHLIDKGACYFGIRDAGRLVAVAAAEIDPWAENAEMTDFATRAEWRGSGLAGILLRHMESTVADRGIKTAYTIARANAEDMNRVFMRQGYHYAGWLPNNTQVGGRIESMLVWYKPLENPTHKKRLQPGLLKDDS
jgi:putative beta-lysine N-acetyltransferase